MKILIVTFVVSASLAGQALCTPAQSDWGRLVFIGHNDSSYFCFFTHRTYPGNDYNFTDSVFVCRFSDSLPVRMEKHLLSVSEYKVHGDIPGPGNWDTLTATFPFALAAFLRQNGVSFEFPSVDLDNFCPAFDEGNIVLQKGKRAITISRNTDNLTRLRPLLNMSRWNNVEMAKHFSSFVGQTGKIVEYFRDNSTYFFVVSLGSNAIDMNYFQYVVPVPLSRVWSVVRSLEQR